MIFRNSFLILCAITLFTSTTPLLALVSTSVALNRIGRASRLAQHYTDAMASYHKATRPPKNWASMNAAKDKMMACINMLLTDQTRDVRTKEAHESLLQNLLDKHTEIQEKLTSKTPLPQRIGLRRNHRKTRTTSPSHTHHPQRTLPTATAAIVSQPTPRHSLVEWETHNRAHMLSAERPPQMPTAWEYYDPAAVRKTVLSTLKRGSRRAGPRRTPTVRSQPAQPTRTEDGWQAYDASLWDSTPSDHLPSKVRTPQPQTITDAWTQRARANIDQHPMASEGQDFDVIHKAVDAQNGIDCGFHTACNGYEAVKAIAHLHGTTHAQQTLQSLRVQSRAEIQSKKRSFDGGRDLHRCLETQELTNFIAFCLRSSPIKNTSGHIIQPLQNPHNSNFYWTILEYIQATQDRNILINALKFLEIVHNKPDDINLAKQALYQTGTLVWPEFEEVSFSDPRITMAQFQNLAMCKQLIKQIMRGEQSQYLESIRAFRQGKPVITAFLDHSGTGDGHWSCKVFIPKKRNPQSIRPDYATIINMDSGIGGHISSDTKRFVFDLLHLDLPNASHLEAINSILPPNRI